MTLTICANPNGRERLWIMCDWWESSVWAPVSLFCIQYQKKQEEKLNSLATKQAYIFCLRTLLNFVLKMISYLFCRVECITDASVSTYHRCIAFFLHFKPFECVFLCLFWTFSRPLCCKSLSLSRVCGCLPVSCGRCSFSKAEANGESGKGAERLGSCPVPH